MYILTEIEMSQQSACRNVVGLAHYIATNNSCRNEVRVAI